MNEKRARKKGKEKRERKKEKKKNVLHFKRAFPHKIDFLNIKLC